MKKCKDNDDKRIKTLDELKEYCEYKDDKYIQYYKETGEWWIEHQISDAEEEFKDDTALKSGYPMLFEAMQKGCLIKYDWGNNE